MLVCPRCRAPLSTGEVCCTRCGSGLPALHRLLGDQQVRVECLIDYAGSLALRDTQRLRQLLDDFQRRFPQTYCVVFIGSLLPEVSPSEAGFWLLNQGLCEQGAAPRTGRYGIAIIIDPAGRRAGLCLGYGLEALLPQSIGQDLLRRAELHLCHDEHFRAVRAMLSALDRKLRAQGKATRRVQSGDGPTPSHLGFEPLPKNAVGKTVPKV